MYGWIWRKLPGGTFAKLVGCLVLFALTVAVLFLLVFPAIEPLLPFDNITVNN